MLCATVEQALHDFEGGLADLDRALRADSGSVVIAVLATVWRVERAFVVKLIS